MPDALLGERAIIRGLVGHRTRRSALLRVLLSPLSQPIDSIRAKALEIGSQLNERGVSEHSAARRRAVRRFTQRLRRAVESGELRAKRLQFGILRLYVGVEFLRLLA